MASKKSFPVKSQRAKPFLKWAGGKSQLLNDLVNRLPQKIKKTQKIKRYVEPFVGSGALFFKLKNNFQVDDSYLVDINRELIVGWKVIKNNPQELVKKLNSLQNSYHRKTEEERKKFYYEIRDEYNKQMHHFNYSQYNTEWVERATYLIFLNRTCFNGLFRVNSKGEFNVPFGRYKNPRICDKDNIMAVSATLENTKIQCMDFYRSEEWITQGSFVYLDPPYRPISETAYFTGYSNQGFGEKEQKRLAEFFKEMDERGAYLMLSNSDPKNEDPEDEFFDELYKGFYIQRVDAKRFINCDASGRGPIKELIIRNYRNSENKK